MSIRLATKTDAEAISELVLASATPNRRLDFDEIGWSRFLELNTPAEMGKRICDERRFTLCYELDKRLAGIITIRDNEKLDQLFVHPTEWNKKIALKLWHAARRICVERGGGEYFWVKSSAMAVPVYRKLGFIAVGDRQIENGIAYQRMVLAPVSES